ncbi:MAG: hypothetical protein J1F12_00965 [Muribaculaceae bacterium]|nr:hypothetical protein [Muribaculaceae bacterium]
MKFNKIKHLFGWLAIASMFMVTSCKDDTFANYGDDLSGDEVKVSFTIAPEAAAVSTRAEENSKLKTTHISDGSKANVLIYAVYWWNPDEKTYELLDKYGLGADDGLDQSYFGHGEAQTAKRVTDGFPFTINLTLKKGQTYTVAFWAQNENCRAYDFSDLRKVEVKYSLVNSLDHSDSTEASLTPNNDELRDAFCRSVEIEVTGNNMTQNVYLYRPLSQINIGTSGYDYEVITRDAHVKYTHSRVRINRAARYLDVVRDKTYWSTTSDDPYGEKDQADYADKTAEAFAVVDFARAPIPAYAECEIPDFPSFSKFDWEYNRPDVRSFDQTVFDSSKWYLWDDEEGTHYEKNPYHEGMKYDQYLNEEFLKVHLYNDEEKFDSEGKPKDGFMDDKHGEYVVEDGVPVSHGKDGYLDYANLENNDGKKGETFKWLSMCYILTSSTKDEAVVVNNVRMWLSDGTEENEKLVLDINHVPVQRNWRTNIVSHELLTEKPTIEVKLDKDFAGEYSGWSNGEDWEWSGPLADGVYYNAKDDVIEISNRNGLIWFQQMVNGKMVVRETVYAEDLGKSYPYYDLQGNEKYFTAPYIEEPKDPKLRERIMVATHQKVASVHQKSASEEGWPPGGNFHFSGNAARKDRVFPSCIQRNQATVRLMADIDLSGIEWIPIGFECHNLDQGRDTFKPGELFSDSKAIASISRYGDWSFRGFFGIFDGNGHTISNMTIKKFGAQVHPRSRQANNAIAGSCTDENENDKYRDNKPYDNPTWFARGFFGMIGENAQVKNLRLTNIDVLGYNNVGGLVGYAYGNHIVIDNCVIDGGTIKNIPMLRAEEKAPDQDRTYARGANTGGLIGCFNTEAKDVDQNGVKVKMSGEVTNCEVRNLYIQGFRRLGGLIGSLEMLNPHNTGAKVNLSKSYPDKINNNKISNSVVMLSQIYPFNYLKNVYENGLYKTGYGYLADTYLSFAQTFVGGDDVDWGVYKDASKVKENLNNSASNVSLLDFGIYYFEPDKDGKDPSVPPFYDMQEDYKKNRVTQLGKADLQYLPILSSWFMDKVYLTANYTGTPSAYTKILMNRYNIHCNIDNWGANYDNSDKETKETFSFPANLPFDEEINWVTSSSRAGLYVESVLVDGKGGMGGRSVITPSYVDKEGSCTMFVTARDRYEYQQSGILPNWDSSDWYKQPTTIKNVVLRGDPYAWAGIMIAPNKNMSEVNVEKVNIYDVYQTIALDPTLKVNESDVSQSKNWWPNGIEMNKDQNLNVTSSNLRGFTNPGEKWGKVTFTDVTFGAGLRTKHNNGTHEEHTCLVKSTTDFYGCYFKAPFDIVRENVSVEWIFERYGNQACVATGQSVTNKPIDPPYDCVRIQITTSANGDPEITYHLHDGTLLDEDYKEKK